MQLRPYQQEAVSAAITWMKKSVEPAVLDIATGAGKSFIIAAIANWLYEHTGKKVLCIQPSKELTEQNYEKFLLTGNKASFFSASVGEKDLSNYVVYGTPMSIKNQIELFGDMFAAVINDECHNLTPTIKSIISQIKSHNENLRVIGLTATPYRMKNGYIYKADVEGRTVPADEARNPYYHSCIYKLHTKELINMGFLTDVVTDTVAENYNAGNLQLNNRGQFDPKDLERVFEGQGRKTAEIINDVVNLSTNRNGVMIFAATVQHAKECLESLPAGQAGMLGGNINMKKKEREKLINDFKERRIKYIVSVGTLTTGFDAPHVDVIAVLRATESPGLFQQIIGRGLRLHEEKENCLLLDYAENIERHSLQDDLFSPKIQVSKESNSEKMVVICPECGFENEFAARENEAGFDISKDGYFLDLNGNHIDTEFGPLPAHYGRRCQNELLDSLLIRGKFVRCEYRWTSKECPTCKAENDIAARYCSTCKAEIVDPNEKLRREYTRVKKDPYEKTTDKVLNWEVKPSISRAGNEMLVVTYTTEYRTFNMYYMPGSDYVMARKAWNDLCMAIHGTEKKSVQEFMEGLSFLNPPPKTITVYKQRGKDFFRIVDYNKPEDKQPEVL